jgi:hypothetical protein
MDMINIHQRDPVMATDAQVFDYLKKMNPGDSLSVMVDGTKKDATLIRRGRQNARLRLVSTGELVLAPLSDIPLPIESTLGE